MFENAVTGGGGNVVKSGSCHLAPLCKSEGGAWARFKNLRTCRKPAIDRIYEDYRLLIGAGAFLGTKSPRMHMPKHPGGAEVDPV
jgi:hypothetical protein